MLLRRQQPRKGGDGGDSDGDDGDDDDNFSNTRVVALAAVDEAVRRLLHNAGGTAPATTGSGSGSGGGSGSGSGGGGGNSKVGSGIEAGGGARQVKFCEYSKCRRKQMEGYGFCGPF